MFFRRLVLEPFSHIPRHPPVMMLPTKARPFTVAVMLPLSVAAVVEAVPMGQQLPLVAVPGTAIVHL